MRVWNIIENYAYYFAAAAILVVAVYLALQDKTVSSAVMAGLFALTVMFSNIKNLESFKAFGVEGTLRKTLAEAQASLDQLRLLTSVSARQTFYQLASVGRFVDGIDEKEILARELNKLILDLGITKPNIVRAQEPYVGMIINDLYSSYTKGALALTLDEINKSNNEIYGLPADQPMPSDVQQKMRIIGLRSRRLSEILDILNRPFSDESFEKINSSGFLDEGFKDISLKKMKSLGRFIMRLRSECANEGHYTDEALQFVKIYGPYSNDSKRGESLVMSKYADYDN